MANLQGFAQDPELFKTWYLRELFGDFNSIVVDDISPPINPTLTIAGTLAYSGEAACNTLTGTMSYDSATNRFEILSFERTLLTCSEQAHEIFEAEYFMFFEVGRYFNAFVSIETNGEQTLATNGPWFPHLVLKNYLLDVPENDELNITVYPNPVTETLFISSEGITIEKIKVYSISGQIILSSENVQNSIDVSGLSEGLYFLEIFSSEGKSILKFIKR